MNYYQPTTIDYRNTVFETAGLTKIHGEPTMATLLTLQNELKANAQSFQSMLGGGNNGHLVLALTAAVYVCIPGTAAYVGPLQSVLNFPTGGTQYQIAQAQTIYNDALHLFYQVNNVEHELKKQIVAAVDKKYIKAIRNSMSNNIAFTIPQILDHLFDNYGDVTAEELHNLKTQVENKSYNIREFVENTFIEIEDLKDIVKLAKDSITKQQVDIKGWNCKAKHQDQILHCTKGTLQIRRAHH
eukprot:13785887-Ditylum_brightwellii.AAC.1